jgi:single-strand DNA-binding protein
MSGRNIAIVSGYIGQDIEMKTTTTGKMVAHGSLGVQQGYGEKKRTIWVKFEAWDKQAEFLGRWGRKGTALTITGHIDVKEWMAPEDSRKHSEMVLIADMAEFALTAKNEPKEMPKKPEPAQAVDPEPVLVDEDDELPF